MNAPALRKLASENDSEMSWRKLTWDSEQFGFAAARLEIGCSDKAVLRRILEQCRANGIRHLVTRVNAAAVSTIQMLEQAGFELLDGIQTFVLRLEDAQVGKFGRAVAVRQFQPGDRMQVLHIARTSYVFDRFHADSSLGPGVADRVNETWVDNCCNGNMADAVFVSEEAGAILGFATCSIDREASVGVIGMVAVKDVSRRRGIAAAITSELLCWARTQGVDQIEVGTQLANIPAARLYESFGFRTTAVNLTFRKKL
jgi:GNAT superfamily N-acetyltransferase